MNDHDDGQRFNSKLIKIRHLVERNIPFDSK